ncbi:MAG: hypothetical protein AVDCRST_MAG13-1472, partial [uncultured Solirubrobacteraceae bacterium]
AAALIAPPALRGGRLHHRRGPGCGVRPRRRPPRDTDPGRHGEHHDLPDEGARAGILAAARDRRERAVGRLRPAHPGVRELRHPGPRAARRRRPVGRLEHHPPRRDLHGRRGHVHRRRRPGRHGRAGRGDLLRPVDPRQARLGLPGGARRHAVRHGSREGAGRRRRGHRRGLRHRRRPGRHDREPHRSRGDDLRGRHVRHAARRLQARGEHGPLGAGRGAPHEPHGHDDRQSRHVGGSRDHEPHRRQRHQHHEPDGGQRALHGDGGSHAEHGGLVRGRRPARPGDRVRRRVDVDVDVRDRHDDRRRPGRGRRARRRHVHRGGQGVRPLRPVRQRPLPDDHREPPAPVRPAQPAGRPQRRRGRPGLERQRRGGRAGLPRLPPGPGRRHARAGLPAHRAQHLPGRRPAAPRERTGQLRRGRRRLRVPRCPAPGRPVQRGGRRRRQPAAQPARRPHGDAGRRQRQAHLDAAGSRGSRRRVVRPRRPRGPADLLLQRLPRRRALRRPLRPDLHRRAARVDGQRLGRRVPHLLRDLRRPPSGGVGEGHRGVAM